MLIISTTWHSCGIASPSTVPPATTMLDLMALLPAAAYPGQEPNLIEEPAYV